MVNKCTCHERDSSQTCDYCKSQGLFGHMETDLELDCLHQRIAALEAELQPWRQMARQLEAIWKEGYFVVIDSYEPPVSVAVLVYDTEWDCHAETGGHSLPTAVNAAYEQVKGVGDE